MSRQILALDIRRNALAAVLLNTGIKSNWIQECILIPFKDGSDETARLTTALQQLADRVKLAAMNAVVALPAEQAIIRPLTLPFSDEKKIRQILPFELEPALPIPVDDLVIDFTLCSDNPQQHDLLTVAMDRHKVQAYRETLEQCGIKPQLIVAGAFPLAIALLAYDNELPDRSVLIDIDIRHATLFIINNHHVAMVRTISIETATPAGFENLILKIRQTLTSYDDNRPGGYTASQVLLCGAGLEILKKDCAVFESGLGIPTRISDLRAKLPRVEKPDLLKVWRPESMDNALALALLEAEGRSCPNFHRSSSPLRNLWTTYRSTIRTPAVLLGVVLLLALGNVLLEGYTLRNRIGQIDQQIASLFQASLPNARRVGDPLDQIKSEIKKLKESALDPSLNAGKMRNVDLLNHISRLIPTELDVVFDRLVSGSDSVSISGETSSFKVVDDIKVRLEQSNLFSKVTIASANMEKTGDKVNFKLTIEI